MIKVSVTEEMIERAKKFRHKRDRWRNRIPFAEQNGRTRWVGDLSEIVLDQFLRANGIGHWWNPDANLSYDFVIYHKRIEVKGMTRQGPVLPGYTHSVNLEQAKQSEADAWFFASYEEPTREMWMVGGCSRAKMKTFPIITQGENIHEKYKVSNQVGKRIINVPYDELTPASEWLNLKENR